MRAPCCQARPRWKYLSIRSIGLSKAAATASESCKESLNGSHTNRGMSSHRWTKFHPNSFRVRWWSWRVLFLSDVVKFVLIAFVLFVRLLCVYQLRFIPDSLVLWRSLGWEFKFGVKLEISVFRVTFKQLLIKLRLEWLQRLFWLCLVLPSLSLIWVYSTLTHLLLLILNSL